MAGVRIGIGFGGSKIEVAALAPDGSLALRRRVPTPSAYRDALAAIAGLVRQAEAEMGPATVGIGLPGRIDPETQIVRNGNCLNGHPFQHDIGAALGREVRVANDALCFALSEAVDGAGAGARSVFGVILGTGCGGGLVVGGQALQGRNGVAGEWGHNPFPFRRPEELPGRRCWCGQYGCNETVLAGPGLAIDCDGPGARDSLAVARRAEAGDPAAQAALRRHAERLAVALAQVVNLFDPDVIVLGGGLSNMPHLTEEVPTLMPAHVFGGRCRTALRRNRHGDSSGVRGGAWLWPAAADHGT